MTNALLVLASVASICLCFVQTTAAEGQIGSLTGHVVYGWMTIPTDEQNPEEDFDAPVFGVDAQKALGGTSFRYGYETGLLFSMETDSRVVYAASGNSGGKIAVSVDVNSILIDYFAGGFLSWEPAPWIRVGVGAGPLLVWSQWETESAESTGDRDTTRTDSGFGVGVYGRAGVDLFFTESAGLYIGARINRTTLVLESDMGDVDIEGWQYYGGLAMRF